MMMMKKLFEWAEEASVSESEVSGERKSFNEW